MEVVVAAGCRQQLVAYSEARSWHHLSMWLIATSRRIRLWVLGCTTHTGQLCWLVMGVAWHFER
jgi:hypothetical protein